MVHVGKLWPTNIWLRIYNTVEVWPNWIPMVSIMTAYDWDGTINLPDDVEGAEAVLYDWSEGDPQLQYRTEQVGPGPEVIQIGWERRLLADHVTWETICQVWVDDDPQMLWHPNESNDVTWSGWGPTFPVAAKKPGAVAWPTLSFGQFAKLWPT